MSHGETRIEAVFLRALEIQSPEERAAYLQRACAGDDKLRGRVKRMLDAQPQLGSFLDQNAAEMVLTRQQPAVERLGTQIGPYKLLQQIGEGGMGTVFMAEQTHPVQRKVALKLIKAGMDSRQVIARFEAERQALAIMDHVNIARVLDAGATEADRPYFVMELVHGVPITKYCDDNHLTPRERLELFVPVCQAIQHAHQKGIIHRDVKPSNVMITLYDGKPVPKVIDFGVAKAIEQTLAERTLFTQYGTMVGTPEYMSPEQAEMSALGVDTRSDIYSLGVLLFELLTGSTPLSHKRLKVAAYGEMLRMIREEEPPRPSTRLGESGEELVTISAQRHMEPAKLKRLLRGELDWIVMKTLEKDRNRRYATANGMALDIQRYLQDETVLACPPSAGYRARKFARRHKRVLETAGVVAFALILGTAVSTWQAFRATRAEGLAHVRLASETKAKNTARDQLRLTQQAQEQATRRLYDSRLAQARAGSLSRRVGHRLDSLAVLGEAAMIARGLNLPGQSLLERRNAAIACLALTDLRLAKQWPGWPPGSDLEDFDGKLEHYARVDKHGAVSIRRVAGDEEIARLPETGAETWVIFSRDGKFLAVGSTRGLKVWKLGGDEPVMVVSLPAGDSYGFDFSADSRQCAIGRVDGPIRLYDLASGRPPRELPNARLGAELAFHPGGRQLAVSCDTSVEIRDLETGKVIADLRHPDTANELAWHPDGKTLAVVGGDSRIYLWDVAAGKQTLVLEGLRNQGTAIAFNHEGDLLASLGWEGMLRLWDPRTGKQLFSTMSWGTRPRFSLDDRLLAADMRDGNIGLWEVTVCREYRTLVRAARAGKSVYEITSIRLDGRLLAVAMQDGVGLWDLTRGTELAFLKLPGCAFVMFEPSGALLTTASAGLLRWPIRAEPATPGLLRIGPPHKLSVPGPFCHIACNANGQVIALSQFQGGRVLHADRGDQPVRLQPHDDARYVAVSPDGRWVATGSHTGTGVKIWDARSGECQKELPVDGARVGFSPDGKWLATTGSRPRLWMVGSWQEGPQIGGVFFAFSPDGKLLAVETGYGAVRLVDPNTGREFARLDDPNQDRAFHLSFSPDGTQLVASNNDSQSIHVWDLRTIREQLVKLGLDWDLPPYPARGPDDGQPLQVEVDTGALGAMLQAQDARRQASDFLKSKQWEKAIGALAQAVELEPRNAQTLNSLAWLLATCRDAKSRDLGRALGLAASACELTPKEGRAWNTLGVAQYRAGDWKAAIAALAKSNELAGQEDLSFKAFFLSMAYWRLGEKPQALSWYDKAVQWMQKNRPADDELVRFRAEAAALLEVKATKD